MVGAMSQNERDKLVIIMLNVDKLAPNHNSSEVFYESTFFSLILDM